MPLVLMPSPPPPRPARRQSSSSSPSSRARANSGAAARAAASDASLKLDSSGGGRWPASSAAGSRPRRARSRPRGPRQGLISTLQPSPSSPKQAIASSKVGTSAGSSARGVSATSRSMPVVRLSESSCIRIGTPSAVSLTSISTQVAPRRRGLAERSQRVFRGIGRGPAMADDFRQLQHSPIQS